MQIERWFAGVAVAGGLALVLAGCEQEEVRIYDAPKDPPSVQTQVPAPGVPGTPGAMPTNADGTAQPAAGELTWTAPESWERVPGEQAMRLATYRAGEGERQLEVVVSAFAGDVGGELANINRWRRDPLGLPPLDEAQWRDHAERFGDDDAPVHGWTMRIDGDEQGTLAAIIQTDVTDRTWFVRATGDVAQLDAHEADVVAFAHTFEPADAHDHDHDHDHDHSSPGGVDGGASLSPPADWREARNASAISYATYHVGPVAREAVVVVTPMNDDGGGLLLNVNMWRGTLGLPALDDVDQQPVERLTVGDQTATLVALDGAEGEVSVVAAMVPTDDGRTWFFRLSGPTETVHALRGEFERFVTTARFTGN